MNCHGMNGDSLAAKQFYRNTGFNQPNTARSALKVRLALLQAAAGAALH